MIIRFIAIALLSTLSFTANALAKPVAYQAVFTDEKGQLHIVTEDGQESLAPKMEDQTGFSNAKISPDRLTIGWFVEYAAPTTYYPNQLNGKLVLYRDGKITHVFDTEQIFYDWTFVDNGRKIVYCTGATHGGPNYCILANAKSAKPIRKWLPTSDNLDAPPKWAANLWGIKGSSQNK